MKTKEMRKDAINKKTKIASKKSILNSIFASSFRFNLASAINSKIFHCKNFQMSLKNLVSRKILIFPFLMMLLLAVIASAGDVIVESGKLDVDSKLIVDDLGDVGIGVLVPTEKLDVDGNIKASGTICDSGGTNCIGSSTTGWTDGGTDVYLTTITDLVGIGTETPNRKLEIKSNTGDDNVVEIDSDAGKYSSVDFMDNGVAKWGIGKNPSNNFYIDESGVGNALTILPGGSVGIGTIPEYKLEISAGTGRGLKVRSDADYPLVIGNAADNIVYMAVNNDNVGIGIAVPTEKLDVDGNIKASGTICDVNGCIGSGGGFWLQSGTDPNDIYYNTGDVGIGTANPGARLEIKGPAADTDIFRVERSFDTNALLVLRDVSNDGELEVFRGAGISSFKVRNDGKVGIGTDDPSSKLTIVGNLWDSFTITDAAGSNRLRTYISSGGGMIQLYDGSGTTESTRIDGRSSQDSWFNTGGRVGIGTVSPSKTLHVYKDSPSVVEVANFETTDHNRIRLSAGASNGFRAYTNNIFTQELVLDNNGELQWNDNDDRQAIIRPDASAQNDDGWVTAAVDYAEFMEKLDSSEAIAIYEVIGVKNGKITKNTNNATLFMVTSTDSGLRGGNPLIEGYSRDDDPNWVAVAYIGQVPVIVNGDVNEGDYVIPSGNHDGKAIAVSPNEITREQFNQAIGRALESMENPIYNTLDVHQDPNDPDQDSEIFFELEKMQRRRGESNIINVAVGVHLGLPSGVEDESNEQPFTYLFEIIKKHEKKINAQQKEIEQLKSII